MVQNTRQYSGFTIVELLIVVVVIAILAAITIVSYNGIQSRARAAAIQSTTSQAAKKVLIYSIQNSDTFPTTLAEAGVTSDTTTYQYSVDNTVSPKTFCITATNQAVSYWISNTSGQPAVGACPGHGVNGATPVTNQFNNPFYLGPDLPVNYASTINQTIIDVDGTKYAQGETTATGASSILLSPYAKRWAISAAQNVVTRVTVRNANSTARNFSVALRFFTSTGNSSGTLISSPASGLTSIPSGGTAVLTISAVAPATTASVAVSVIRNSGNALVGDLIQATGVWLGDTDANPASGDSPGWVWNGTPNNSTSTGSPL